MPLGNRQSSVRSQDVPRLCCPQPLDPRRPAGYIQDLPSAGRVSSVVRAAVACCWLLVLGGALLARHWPRVAPGARRGTARGVWRVVAHAQSGWVALGRCIFRLYFFC